MRIATWVLGAVAAALILRLGGIGVAWLPHAGLLIVLFLVLAIGMRLPRARSARDLATALRPYTFALCVAALVALALAARLPHLNAELGHTPIDIDEHRLASNVRHYFVTGELDHRTVEHYPGLVFWLFAGASFLDYMVGLTHGRPVAPAALPIELFVASARLANVAVAGGIVLFTALIGRRVFNPATGLLAGAIVAFAPLSTQTTTLVRNDPGMVLATMAAVYFAIVALKQDDRSWLLAGGAAAGIATAIKYSSFPALVPVAMAACGPDRGPSRTRRALATFGAFGLAVAITNHFVWADFPNFLRQLSDQVAITGPGHWAATDNPGRVYVDILVSQGVGWALLVAAAAFAVYALAVLRYEYLVLLAFPLLYLWFMAQRPSQFPRWVFPMLPFVALASSAVVAAIARFEVTGTARWKPRRWARWSAALLCAALLAQPLRLAATALSRTMRQPTYAIAEEWVRAHVSEGETILTEKGWLQLERPGITVRRVPSLTKLFDGGLDNLQDADWIVVPETDFGHPLLKQLAFEYRIHASQSFGGRTGYDYEMYRVPGRGTRGSGR